MNGYYKLLVPCLVASMYGMTTRPTHVIFDINTIIHPDEDAKETLITQKLNLSRIRCLARAAFGLKLIRSGILPVGTSAFCPHETIKRSFFDVLRTAKDTQAAPVIPYHDADLGEITLPALMAAWLCSHDTATIISTFEEFLAHSALCPEAQEIYRAMAHVTFHEIPFAQTTVVDPKTVKLMQEFAGQDAQLYCIGNMNGHCFEQLQMDSRFKDTLSLIPPQHIYLSYQDRIAKPHPHFYEAACRQFGLDDKSEPVACFESPLTQEHAAASQHFFACSGKRDITSTHTLMPARDCKT